MTTEISNYNSGARPFREASDPHGHAALLLVESLVHGLIARDLLTVQDAVEIVDTAVDVTREIDPETSSSSTSMRKSTSLLDAIGASLRHDLPRE